MYKSKTINFLFILFISMSCIGQSIILENELIIDNLASSSPPDGTIRWSGSDFEGWNGVQWVSLTNNAKLGAMIDNDGLEYTTIRIGYQEWILENLRSETLNDGSKIDEVQGNTLWSSMDTMAFCWYDNNSDYDKDYGKLYNWYTINSGKLCPSGWDIGSETEWQELIGSHGLESNAGTRMKHIGTDFWFSSPNPGLNERGFSGRGGGFRNASGVFSNLKYNGYWWSSSQYDSNNAWFYILGFNDVSIAETAANKNQGLSVRCFRTL